MSPVLVLLPILAAGLAGTIFAVSAMDTDDQFVLRERNLRAVEAKQLESAVVTAPNPIPDSGGRRGDSADCRAGAEDGALRNPWRCTVRYPSGDIVRYRITVRPDRRFRGANRDGSLVVYGCCAGEP